MQLYSFFLFIIFHGFGTPMMIEDDGIVVSPNSILFQLAIKKGDEI